MSNTKNTPPLSKQSLIFAVDFDGTVVEHEYPAVGREVPGAVNVLQRIAQAGHRIILYTMRDNINKAPIWPEGCEITPTVLEQAEEWFKERDIPIWAVNYNPSCSFSKSRKVYAQIYIDDAALGCPLMKREINYQFHIARPMVDWYEIERRLMAMGYISKEGRLPDSFYKDNKLIPIIL